MAWLICLTLSLQATCHSLHVICVHVDCSVLSSVLFCLFVLRVRFLKIIISFIADFPPVAEITFQSQLTSLVRIYAVHIWLPILMFHDRSIDVCFLYRFGAIQIWVVLSSIVFGSKSFKVFIPNAPLRDYPVAISSHY